MKYRNSEIFPPPHVIYQNVPQLKPEKIMEGIFTTFSFLPIFDLHKFEKSKNRDFLTLGGPEKSKNLLFSG